METGVRRTTLCAVIEPVSFDFFRLPVIDFHTPIALLLLLVLPFWWWWRRKRPGGAIIYSRTALLARCSSTGPASAVAQAPRASNRTAIRGRTVMGDSSKGQGTTGRENSGRHGGS